MKKSYIIIVLLILLNTFICYRFISTKRYDDMIIQSLSENSEERAYLWGHLSNSILNDGRKLNGLLVRDSIGDELVVRDMFQPNEKRLLICRFSEKYCQSCVKYAIDAIEHSLNFDETLNVVYWADCERSDSLRRYIDDYSLRDKRVFNVTNIDIHFEHSISPYYLIVDTSMQILSTYMPHKETYSLDSIFINQLYNRYYFEE